MLLALDRYFATYEKTTPDFVARVWLGDAYAGEHAFRGRTTERHQIDVPMAQLGGAGDDADLRHREGRQGAALLPHRHALRAGEPAARARRPRLRRRARSTRASTIRRTCAARRTARGAIRAGARVRVR